MVMKLCDVTTVWAVISTHIEFATLAFMLEGAVVYVCTVCTKVGRVYINENSSTNDRRSSCISQESPVAFYLSGDL